MANSGTLNFKKLAISGVITILFCLMSLLVGLLAGLKPAMVIVVAVMVVGTISCLGAFDYSILALLILRSAIDTFYAIQLPAIFAVGIDFLAIAYIIIRILRRDTIFTDGFLFFLGGWCAFQSVWVLLMAFGGLGGGSYLLGDSIREIIRLVSWFLIYLLIMQFKGRISPNRMASLLLLALICPLVVALLQITVPNILPTEISPLVRAVRGPGPDEVGLRIRGTVGHPNGFATFLFFFIGLTYWKLLADKGRRWIWGTTLAILGLFYVTTKALFSLGMLAIFIVGTVARRLSPARLILGILLFGTILGLFASSSYGQDRLASIAQTPLLNPDIDASRAIILSRTDYNSFNWRIAQWTEYLTKWQQHPWFGHGIGVSAKLSSNDLEPHNDYVRWLFEQGIVGFTGIIAFFSAQFYRLFQLARAQTSTPSQKNLCYIMIVMLVALLFGMITENIWDHTMLFFYWWVLLAVAGWDWQEEEQPTALPRQPRSPSRNLEG